MKAVFLGATRGMGLSLVRRMAARGDTLHLLGRDDDTLARVAAELKQRGAPSVTWGRLDLADDPATFGPALDAADEALDGFGTVIVTAALQAEQEPLEEDPALCREMLTVNFTHTVLFCEEARRRLLPHRGTLAVFSSVAGERARGPKVLYGSTKAGLSYYLEGLDHRYRRHGLRTVTIIPGFITTEANDGIDPPPFSGDPDAIAPAILRAIDRGRPRTFVPRIWRLVMLVIRHLPRWVMRRARF